MPRGLQGSDEDILSQGLGRMALSPKPTACAQTSHHNSASTPLTFSLSKGKVPGLGMDSKNLLQNKQVSPYDSPKGSPRSFSAACATGRLDTSAKAREGGSSPTSLPPLGTSSYGSRNSPDANKPSSSMRTPEPPSKGKGATASHSNLARGVFSKLRLSTSTSFHSTLSPSHGGVSKNLSPHEQVNLMYNNRQEFENLHILGVGGFGHVRLVRHKPTGQYMAMKVMRKHDIVRLKQVDHVNSERAILADLNYPLCVRLHATFVDSANLYMLLDFVPGGEVFSYLRKARRFDVDTARFYCASVLCAMEHMHSMNIVYRDLKPENLLLDRKGYLKVTDFGFAKKVFDRTWTLCGTPEYLAPEIIQSKGHNKGVDWWALGVLLYEFIAGYPPFYDENPFRIYEKILVGVVDFPAHFDPQARDLVRRLLVADRSKRYGCLKDGAGDIKRHPFFSNFDFRALVAGELKAPIVPTLTHDGDSRNFDTYDEPEEVQPHQIIDSETSRRLFYEFFEFEEHRARSGRSPIGTPNRGD